MRPFRIYRNTHSNNYTILGRTPEGTWRKVDEADELTVEDTAFLIQPGGQARVRKEKKKYVHAFVCCGTYEKGSITLPQTHYRLSYNPYRDDSFVYSKGKRGLKLEAPLYHRRLYMRTDGVYTTTGVPNAVPCET